MKTKNLFIFALMAITASFFLTSCNYNTLVEQEQAVETQWANVETAYQRRADLIPNLVATVKGAADFEKSTLESVIAARAKATSINVTTDDLTPENIQKFQQAQSQLSGALSRLLVTVERYPELKANKNFIELQAQIEGTENRISVERKKFNEAVGAFNAAIKKFPTLIYASWFGFEPKTRFAADEGAENAPHVKFDFN